MSLNAHHRNVMDAAAASTLRAWRKIERERRIAARVALPDDALAAYRHQIDRLLTQMFPDLARGVLGICWPFKAEYDARHLAAELRVAGSETALPVVIAPKTPLVFRVWQPGDPLAEGVYAIPYPTTGRSVIPDTVLLPMNGFDDAGYRLGYGGGFFDRTLAAAPRRPRTIGVAYEMAHIATIQPQPYDIPMDYIVTEQAVYRRADNPARLERMEPSAPA